jgi:hypothetical protein
MNRVGVIALSLLACAALLVLAAEWPRLAPRVAGARAGRSRARRKRRFSVVDGAAESEDDFAAAVERDLANLPVTGEPDDRQRPKPR